jgi:hypothetical protein
MSIGSHDALITAFVVPVDLGFPDIMAHFPGLYLLNYYAGFLK